MREEEGGLGTLYDAATGGMMTAIIHSIFTRKYH
jgi:hypothetical protein